jgi:hypothetical protein
MPSVPENDGEEEGRAPSKSSWGFGTKIGRRGTAADEMNGGKWQK